DDDVVRPIERDCVKEAVRRVAGVNVIIVAMVGMIARELTALVKGEIERIDDVPGAVGPLEWAKSAPSAPERVGPEQPAFRVGDEPVGGFVLAYVRRVGPRIIADRTLKRQRDQPASHRVFLRGGRAMDADGSP